MNNLKLANLKSLGLWTSIDQTIRLDIKRTLEHWNKVIIPIKQLSDKYADIDNFEEFAALVLNHEMMHHILFHLDDFDGWRYTKALDNIANRYERDGYWL